MSVAEVIIAAQSLGKGYALKAYVRGVANKEIFTIIRPTKNHTVISVGNSLSKGEVLEIAIATCSDHEIEAVENHLMKRDAR